MRSSCLQFAPETGNYDCMQLLKGLAHGTLSGSDSVMDENKKEHVSHYLVICSIFSAGFSTHCNFYFSDELFTDNIELRKPCVLFGFMCEKGL
jgi:hypothetical protein